MSPKRKHFVNILWAVAAVLLSFWTYFLGKNNSWKQNSQLLLNHASSRNASMAKTSTPANASDPTESSMKKLPNVTLYITPGYNGGLGNQMFQFASAYGVARTVGKLVHTVSSDQLLSIFPHIRQRVFVTESHDQIRDRRVIRDPKDCAYMPQVIEEARALNNFTMAGYFQSWKYFANVRDEIRGMFRLRDDLIVEADRTLAKIRDSYLLSTWANATAGGGSNTSSSPPSSQSHQRQQRIYRRTKAPDNFVFLTLHVRRGDYLSQRSLNYGYELATGDYIRKALTYFGIKYRSQTTALIVVVVTQDSDLDWCHSQITSEDDVDYLHYVSGNSQTQDLALMMQCNATVMTVGTFGWWSGFLAGGEAIYYAFPFKEGSGLAAVFSDDQQDFFWPTWKPLA